MLDYDGVLDVLSATLVIVAAAVVIAASWLSTRVREQPLVATAVVVFHSGGSGGGGVESSDDVMETATEGGGGSEEVATGGAEKESEATSNGSDTGTTEGGMEVREVRGTQCEASPSRTQSLGTTRGLDQVPEASNVGASGYELPTESFRDRDLGEGNDLGAMGVQDVSATSSRLAPEMQVRRRAGCVRGEARDRELKEGKTQEVEESSDLADRIANDTGLKDGKVQEMTSVEEKDTQSKESKAQEVKESLDVQETRPPGSIKIRLKFLDETQRYVFAQLTEKVGSFKRQHFSIELDANRHIRLIFNGQLLSQDSSTLAQYGLFDNCVVHCHVSQPRLIPSGGGQSGEAAAQEEEDAYVSRLLAPLLYGVMVLMWYLRYEYGHLFNTMSTIILFFLTALLLISTYLLYVSHHGQQTTTNAAAHIGIGRTFTAHATHTRTTTHSTPS